MSNKLRVGGVIHVYLVSYSVEEVKHLVSNAVNPSAFSVVSVKRVLDYAPRKYVFRADLRRNA